MKKSCFFIFALLIILPLISAADIINLKIEKTTINNVIVSELNNPATFNLKITNLGSGGDFQVFSLIDVDMTPKGTFKLAPGETKDIEVKVYALDSLRNKPGMLTFVYKIYNLEQGSQEDTLTIEILPIQQALEISTNPITPNSTSATIIINNRVNEPFDIEAEFSSAFFESSQKFHLESLEKKEISVSLNKEKMKTLIAGQYILTANFIIQGKKYKVTGPIRFAEQEGIATQESSSGLFFRIKETQKINEGNIPTTVIINIKKNIISRLFTTFNYKPQVTRKGIYVYYLFQQELKPGESFKVKSTTSWIYPLILLALLLIITYLVYIYTMTDLILKKRVAFVKTKSGEFALRIYLTAKSRKFVEKIEITDKLPALVRIYEKFSSNPPDKVDHKRHRISWSIESLQPGEERVFNYIIYSKVAIVGKFELSPATAIYEREGKIKEAFSNRTSFLNEPMKGIEYKGE